MNVIKDIATHTLKRIQKTWIDILLTIKNLQSTYISDHKKLYTENGTMHYAVFSVLMKDISNPRLLSKWCKDNELKGYWYYEWNANTSAGGNNRWVTYAFHTVDHANLFFESFKNYVEKEKDRVQFPDPKLESGVYA